MVSVFSGEVTRTWRFPDSEGKGHEVVLYHHPLTGARAAMVDHRELHKSLGTSSIFHNAETLLPFEAGSCKGEIIILRDSMTTFAYRCRVNDEDIPEATEIESRPVNDRSHRDVVPGQPTLQVFSVRVAEHCTTKCHVDGKEITWYAVDASARLANGSTATTRVHRRFRDFVEFDETLRASLTGYSTKKSLPRPPQKKARFMADHSDDAFLRDRLRELDTYVKKLVEVPHVWRSTGAPAFVGLSDAVREYSVVFEGKLLGFTLGRAPPKNDGSLPDFPAFVSETHDAPDAIRAGDLLSKVSGRTTSNLAFQQCVAALKYGQRPVMLHLLAPLAGREPRPPPAPVEEAGEKNPFM